MKQLSTNACHIRHICHIRHTRHICHTRHTCHIWLSAAPSAHRQTRHRRSGSTNVATPDLQSLSLMATRQQQFMLHAPSQTSTVFGSRLMAAAVHVVSRSPYVHAPS
jgi:hypothetical protein